MSQLFLGKDRPCPTRPKCRTRPSPGTNHGKENIEILENPALPNPSNAPNSANWTNQCG